MTVAKRLPLTAGEKRMFEFWLNTKLRRGVKLKQARKECYDALERYRVNYAGAMKMRETSAL